MLICVWMLILVHRGSPLSSPSVNSSSNDSWTSKSTAEHSSAPIPLHTMIPNQGIQTPWNTWLITPYVLVVLATFMTGSRSFTSNQTWWSNAHVLMTSQCLIASTIEKLESWWCQDKQNGILAVTNCNNNPFDWDTEFKILLLIDDNVPEPTPAAFPNISAQMPCSGCEQHMSILINPLSTADLTKADSEASINNANFGPKANYYHSLTLKERMASHSSHNLCTMLSHQCYSESARRDQTDDPEDDYDAGLKLADNAELTAS